MSVGLRNRIPMPAALFQALFISRDNSLVRLGMFAFEPGKQSWTKIEANVRVIINCSLDYTFAVDDVCKCVWTIAFVMNAFVPIMIRRGAVLPFDLTGPGILAWRLIEVPVNYKSSHLGNLLVMWFDLQKRTTKL